MVGTPSNNPQHCPPPQQELASNSQSNQHGVPKVGSVTATPQQCAPTQQEDSNNSEADGQRGVPMVGHPANDQHVDTSHPLRDGITSETHSLPHGHTADNMLPADTGSNAQITAQEPIQAEHVPSYPDDDGNGIHSRPATFREPKTAALTSTKAASNPSESNHTLPSMTMTMSSTALLVEKKMPLLLNELSIQKFIHMLLSAFLMA